MADTKISDLTAVVTPALSDVLPVVQGGVTKKETLTQVRTVMVPIVLTADVSGTLPTANQDAQSMGGDCSGTTASCTVAKVNGTTITTAGGALAVGAVLRTTAGGTADWGAVNLADTDAVTGILGLVNGGTGLDAVGTEGQVLATAAGAESMEWITPSTFTPPTGTGFCSVTSGALDAASIKCNLASSTYVTGTLAVGNGGTGVTSLTSFATAITTTGKITAGGQAFNGSIGNVTTGDQDDIPRAAIVRLTDGINVRGIDATGAGDGELVLFIIPGLSTGITFLHNNGGSAAANQITTWNAGTINVYENSFVALRYDLTATKWKFVKEGF
jgi:hypothetical protein